jgi:lysophospholipase L1-like esterase
MGAVKIALANQTRNVNVLFMKSMSRFSRLKLQFLAALILAAILAVLPCRAQMTNAPASGTNDASDVSHFPGLENLPGKHPPHIWNGLAGVWARAHARWKNTASNDVGAVVFLGDSITEGWNGTLARDFPNMHVADRGIGGDITAGVLYRLQDDVLALDPAGIVLLIGTNDIGNDADPADVADNTKQILLAIKKFNPKLKVIVCKVMPRSQNGQPVYDAKIKQVNSMVEDFVKTEPNFAICDTYSIYADDQGNPNPADFNPDHLHLNRAGYVTWKSALDPVIAKMNFPTKSQ